MTKKWRSDSSSLIHVTGRSHSHPSLPRFACRCPWQPFSLHHHHSAGNGFPSQASQRHLSDPSVCAPARGFDCPRRAECLLQPEITSCTCSTMRGVDSVPSLRWRGRQKPRGERRDLDLLKNLKRSLVNRRLWNQIRAYDDGGLARLPTSLEHRSPMASKHTRRGHSAPTPATATATASTATVASAAAAAAHQERSRPPGGSGLPRREGRPGPALLAHSATPCPLDLPLSRRYRPAPASLPRDCRQGK